MGKQAFSSLLIWIALGRLTTRMAMRREILCYRRLQVNLHKCARQDEFAVLINQPYPKPTVKRSQVISEMLNELGHLGSNTASRCAPVLGFNHMVPAPNPQN